MWKIFRHFILLLTVLALFLVSDLFLYACFQIYLKNVYYLDFIRDGLTFDLIYLSLHLYFRTDLFGISLISNKLSTISWSSISYESVSIVLSEIGFIFNSIILSKFLVIFYIGSLNLLLFIILFLTSYKTLLCQSLSGYNYIFNNLIAYFLASNLIIISLSVGFFKAWWSNCFSSIYLNISIFKPNYILSSSLFISALFKRISRISKKTISLNVNLFY